MSEVTPPREEGRDEPLRRPHEAPVVVTHGLTFRDLQRGIFLTFGLILVYQMAAPLTTLLLLFLLVFILAAVLNPLAVKLERRRIPRIATAVIAAVLVVGLLVGIGWFALPPLISEAGHLFTNLDEQQARLTKLYQELVARFPQLQGVLPEPGEIMKNVTPSLTRMAGAVGRYTLNAAVGVMMLFVMLVLVIYTVANPTPLIAGLLSATPERHRGRMERTLRRILQQLKNWALGSLVLGAIIGVLTAIGLWGISLGTQQRIPSILLLSVIAGVGELIPNIGPVLSAVPAVLVAMTVDPSLGLWVALLFFGIQQLENNLIVPRVMGQSLNLHPISVIFTVLVMGALFGLLGSVLAVPVCAIIKVIWEEFYLEPRGTDMKSLEHVAASILNEGSQHPADQNAHQRATDVREPQAADLSDGHCTGETLEAPADRDPKGVGLQPGRPGRV